MGLFGELQEEQFWLDWKDRFETNHGRFIRPDDRKVRKMASNIKTSNSDTRVDVAETAWRHVHKAISYKLSHVWKEPRDTIRSGIGDCEDLAFLLASILPNLGVNNFDLVTGEVRAGGKDEYHVWLRVDGEVIDPTADPKLSNRLKYIEEMHFNINTAE